jgi:ArsR family transcriptional regulator, arsenate/arsenite/antimonite-responsive transcriptional repressor
MTPFGIDAGFRLARLCKALGHPVRVTIVRFLEVQRRGATCGEIVRQLPLAQSTVSEHLRVLKEAGLVEAEEAPPSVVYRVSVQALDAFRREAAAL